MHPGTLLVAIAADDRIMAKSNMYYESSTLDWTTPMREFTVKSMKVGDFIMTRTRRTFTPEFKLQMVRLFENGKSKSEIVREYDLTASALDKWVKNHQNTGSFNHIDNLSEEERELRRLRKDIQQLKMENEILKQAALIMGRK